MPKRTQTPDASSPSGATVGYEAQLWGLADTLPAALDSSSARSPELFAYVAAQNRLGASVLFSHKRVQDHAFLVARRKLMAAIIRRGFETLL